MPINFCHIAPTAYLKTFCTKQTHHLLLAHLVESDEQYAAFYRNLRATKSVTYILDNSCFELYKEGRPMFESSKLLDLAHKVGGVDYIVMSDYPNEDPQKTIQAAQTLAPQFKAAGVGTFFCPQSKIGDLEGLVDSYRWAASSEYVDYIGVSILGVPNAYGVEKANKLQRFTSRWAFMNLLKQKGVLDKIAFNLNKKLHFLGMVDGPNEIALVKDFHSYIDTWDSSAAIWLGLNARSFDQSPTGLLKGKWEEPVDFSFPFKEDYSMFTEENINYINELCKQ